MDANDPEERLARAGIAIPERPAMKFDYRPVAVHRGVALVAGQIPKTGTAEVLHPGRVGDEVSLEQARESARLAVLNGLAHLRGALGSLGGVEQVLRLHGYVAAAERFDRLSEVVDAATDILEVAFGPAGRGPRSVIGVSKLPFRAPVLVELTFAVSD